MEALLFLRRRLAIVQLLCFPIGFQLGVQLVPGPFHQGHMAASLSFALILSGISAAAAEPLALVLSAAGTFFGRGAGPLPAASIFAPFPLSLAIVESTAEMDVRRGGCSRVRRRLVSPATGESPRGDATQGGSSQLMEGPAIDFDVGHEEFSVGGWDEENQLACENPTVFPGDSGLPTATGCATTQRQPPRASKVCVLYYAGANGTWTYTGDWRDCNGYNKP